MPVLPPGNVYWSSVPFEIKNTGCAIAHNPELEYGHNRGRNLVEERLHAAGLAPSDFPPQFFPFRAEARRRCLPAYGGSSSRASPTLRAVSPMRSWAAASASPSRGT